MNPRIFLLLAASLLMATNVYAGKVGPDVDVSDFDIAGLKTGMDLEEARQIAAKRLNVPLAEMKKGYEIFEHPVTHAKLSSVFTYRTNNLRIEVGFVIRVPFDNKRPLALDNVIYEVTGTDQNKAAMKKAALDKYGTPTKEEGNNLDWCVLEPDKSTKDRSMWMCDNDFPMIKLWSERLFLHDYRWKKALRQFEEDRKTTKPNF
ncbi:MAG: hypothetical protein LBS49_13550 [Candidatus Accumulibacter sp.]|nr:hypothetical protein [Accumulibacter sp.]